jgi:hypothetical protein
LELLLLDLAPISTMCTPVARERETISKAAQIVIENFGFCVVIVSSCRRVINLPSDWISLDLPVVECPSTPI